MFDKFVVAYAEGDAGQQWQAPGKDDGYIPRVYFLEPENGDFATVAAPNPSYAYFFSDATSVMKGMTAVAKSGKDEL